MEGSQPFDSELDFEHPRRRRPHQPPPLGGPRRPGRGPRRPRGNRSETLRPDRLGAALDRDRGHDRDRRRRAVRRGDDRLRLRRAHRAVPDDRRRAAVRPGRLRGPAALVVAAFYGDQFQMMIVLAASRSRRCSSPRSRARDRDGVTLSIALTIFGIVWIAIPFAHAVLLRELPDHGAGAAGRRRSSPPSSPTPPPTPAGACSAATAWRPALSPNKTLEGLAFGFVGGTHGLLVRRPLPGLAAGDRRAADGHLRRRAGAGRRPVRVDDQARPADQGLGHDLRPPRRPARPPRRGHVHGRRRLLPGGARSSTEAGRSSAARTNSRSARSALASGPGVSTSTGAPRRRGPIIAAQRLRVDLAVAEVRRGGRRRCRPGRGSRWRAGGRSGR